MRERKHKTKWQDARAATERVVEAYLEREGRKRTTEVREKGDKNAPIRGTVPRSKKNPAAEAAGQKKQTRGHRRKERGYNKARNPRKHTKHKRPLHASAAHVATMHLLARQTNELIRMKYKNLGDFGGTDPVVDSWFLDVAGPYEAMQELTPILKKYKFRWMPASKSWTIHARKYAYNNRKRENFWNAARRNQEAAYPILKKKVREINDRLRAEDATPTPTRKELLREIQQGERISDRLKRLGIEVEYDYPNRYSVDEAKVWLRNTPFDLNPILKKHGFRWGSGRNGKGWWIAMREYTAILKPLVAGIFRAMPVPAEPEPSGGTAVFSDMSHRELSQWLDPVVGRDMEFNEGYDGETSNAEVKRHYMKKLPALKPHEQEQAMESWQRGGLPVLTGRGSGGRGLRYSSDSGGRHA
jgi:hypothetical protein